MRSVAELCSWVDSRGGVVHAGAAKGHGFTIHAIRTAVEQGRLVRVRRSWLARPRGDEELRRAAQVGGRITCVSAARRMQLWAPDHEDLHVVVPSTASRLESSGLRLHWSHGPSPVAATALEDPIVNVLFHAARCLPPADALAVWESAIRNRKASPPVLARIEWHSAAAARIAAMAGDLSDSGLETRFCVLMRALGVAVRQQVWIDGHPVDGLIGEHLAVQLDGFAFHRGKDRRRDLRADARLRLRGYTVLRFDHYQVLFQPDYVIDTVAAALAQGLHR